MKALSTLLIASLLAALSPADAGCQAPKQSSAPQPYNDPDAYEIYSIMLGSSGLAGEVRAKSLVIQEETDVYPQFMPVERCLKDPSLAWSHRDLIDDFKSANQAPRILQRLLKTTLPYQVVSRAKIEGLFGAGGWKAFFETFPDSGGYTQFSAVGFSQDRTRALLYSGYSCGFLCGGGTYYFWVKADGKWKPEDPSPTACRWVS